MLIISGYGNITKAVGELFARLNEPVDENDSAHDGNKRDESPSAGTAHVVKTTPEHAKTGKEKREVDDTAKDSEDFQAGDLKRSEYNTDDECKECPPPVFGARGAALEVDIIVEHFADCFLEAHSAANRGRCLYHIQEFLNDYD